MKNSKSILAVCVLLTFSTIGLASSPYVKAMEQAMEKLGQSHDVATFNDAGNMFDRISLQASTEWHPVYYSAYTRIIMAAITDEIDNKDAYLDVAQEHLDKLKQMDHDASERLVLEGFLYMIRVTVDPATRGQEYSAKSATALQEALALDNNNPRAIYMLGNMSFGTARFFGTDTSDACNMFRTAIELFELEAGNQKNNFDPSWGLNQAQGALQQCGG